VAEKKVSRKALLKEPDEFLSFSARVILYVKENSRQMVALVLLIMACSAAAVSYNSYRTSRERNSHELFLRALRAYEETLEAEEPVSQVKLEALLAQFDYLVSQYGSLPAGEMAQLYAGHVLFKKEDYHGALERYLKMESTSLANQGVRQVFWYHIAETCMALKDYDQAMALFDKLSKDTDSPYRREAYASIARIYELTDRKKEAVQAYRQYLKMFPEAPDAAFVKSRVAELSDQG
jgi:tetratricopeptide (TPR) repeat protein